MSPEKLERKLLHDSLTTGNNERI